MCDDTKSSFEASLSSDLSQRLFFAKNIPSICKEAKPKWIIRQLIPFITNWVKQDEIDTLNCIVSNLKTLIISARGLIHIAPLIVRLTSFEIQTINLKIVKTISKFKNEPTAKIFIDRLFDSDFDATRSLIPKICLILETESEILETLTRVAEDSSFTVKLSLIRILPTLNPRIAYQISNILVSDPLGKIRQYVPAATVGFEFFEELIPIFSSDYEWVVRAALASQLYKIPDYEDVIQIASNLITDCVWEVKLNSAKSLVEILKIKNDIGKMNADELIESFVKQFYDVESVTLKNAFSDLITYMARFGFPKKVMDTFVRNMISVQPPEIIVHFIETLLTIKIEKFTPTIEGMIEATTDKIMHSGSWRVQAQYLGLLPILLENMKDNNAATEVLRIILREACSNGDGSRKAIATFCSRALNHVPDSRKMIENLKDGSYKERQLLIMIAAESNDSEIKQTALNLINDPYENVSLLASTLLNT